MKATLGQRYLSRWCATQAQVGFRRSNGDGCLGWSVRWAIAEGNLRDGAGGLNHGQIPLIYSGRDGHAQRVHWQTILAQNQGRVALLPEASPGTWIYLNLPAPRNLIRAGAANRPPRCLPCGAACATEWKWGCGGGTAQVRFRIGGPGASVDDEGDPGANPTMNGSAAQSSCVVDVIARGFGHGMRLRHGTQLAVPWLGGLERQAKPHALG
jgi:hypothetical protein